MLPFIERQMKKYVNIVIQQKISHKGYGNLKLKRENIKAGSST